MGGDAGNCMRTAGHGRCSEAAKLRRAYQAILQQLQARHRRELCVADALRRQQVGPGFGTRVGVARKQQCVCMMHLL